MAIKTPTVGEFPEWEDENFDDRYLFWLMRSTPEYEQALFQKEQGDPITLSQRRYNPNGIGVDPWYHRTNDFTTLTLDEVKQVGDNWLAQESRYA